MLFTVPRYLQKFASQVLLGILNSSAAKRAAAELAMSFARGHARRRWDGRRARRTRRSIAPAARAVFAPILNKLGFDRLELVICGGAPLPPETMTLWQMLGVNVVEMYGQTETAGGIICGQRGPVPAAGRRRHRAGRLGGQARAETAKCWCASPDLFDCYWNDADATRASRGEDGWLRTGDIGEWHDGALRLVDRARDFIVTSGGKTISPSFIENILRASPYVAEAVVFGHGRKYLTALIEIDADTVPDWARSHDVPYTGFTSLASIRRRAADRAPRSSGRTASWRGPSRSRPSAFCPRRSIPKRTASRSRPRARSSATSCTSASSRWSKTCTMTARSG